MDLHSPDLVGSTALAFGVFRNHFPLAIGDL